MGRSSWRLIAHPLAMASVLLWCTHPWHHSRPLASRRLFPNPQSVILFSGVSGPPLPAYIRWWQL